MILQLRTSKLNETERVIEARLDARLPASYSIVASPVETVVGQVGPAQRMAAHCNNPADLSGPRDATDSGFSFIEALALGLSLSLAIVRGYFSKVKFMHRGGGSSDQRRLEGGGRGFRDINIGGACCLQGSGTGRSMGFN